MTDQEEITELLATEGLLDFSAAGRKKAKQRAAALKKQRADAERAAKRREVADKARKKAELERKAKAELKKKKADAKKVEREKMTEYRKELKELEKRRRKRGRERERIMKEEERRAKKLKAAASPGRKGGRRPGIPDKRDRAAAIVRGYLSRVAVRDDLKGLGLSGVMNVPAATIDTSGLLGMALAFRAAAGEIDMPGSSGKADKSRPWEMIDARKGRTSEERCRALERQIELLEGAVGKLAKNDEHRRALIQQAEKDKATNEKRLAVAEKKARKSDVGQRKKSAKKKKSDGKGEKGGGSSEKKSKSKGEGGKKDDAERGKDEKKNGSKDESDLDEVEAEEVSAVAVAEDMDAEMVKVEVETEDGEEHSPGDKVMHAEEHEHLASDEEAEDVDDEFDSDHRFSDADED